MKTFWLIVLLSPLFLMLIMWVGAWIFVIFGNIEFGLRNKQKAQV